MKTQKKVFTKNRILFSQVQVKTKKKKKKRSSQKWNTFFPRIQVKTCAQMHTIWEWCRRRPYSNYWKGDTVKLLGVYIPPTPPGFGTPEFKTLVWIDSISSASVFPPRKSDSSRRYSDKSQTDCVLTVDWSSDCQESQSCQNDKPPNPKELFDKLQTQFCLPKCFGIIPPKTPQNGTSKIIFLIA